MESTREQKTAMDLRVSRPIKRPLSKELFTTEPVIERLVSAWAEALKDSHAEWPTEHIPND